MQYISECSIRVYDCYIRLFVYNLQINGFNVVVFNICAYLLQRLTFKVLGYK